jgi:hypothetical protein
MFSKVLGLNSQVLIRPGREGDQVRVEALEQQVKELSTAAAFAVDRAEGLQEELQELRRFKQSIQEDQQGITKSLSIRSINTTTSASTNENNSLYSRRNSTRSSITSESDLSSPANSYFDKVDLLSLSPAALRKQLQELRHKSRELESQLQHERSLRLDSEKRELAISNQIEDLSASLFEDVNNRIATEKKTVFMLESKLQSQEDSKNRLHRLEIAIKAIHHARATLNSARLYTYV